MLIAIYHMLKNGLIFNDLGADYYSQFNKERKINACLRKLQSLGWTPQGIAATEFSQVCYIIGGLLRSFAISVGGFQSK